MIRGPRSPVPRAASGTGLARARALAGPFVLWSGTLAAVLVGLLALQGQARTIHAVRPASIEWCDLPAWLSDPQNRDILAEIEAATGLSRADARLDDPALCASVAGGLARSPWVQSVIRVSKRQDGLIRISAAYRRYVTMIVRGATAFLVDEHGVRLPREVRAAYLDPRQWIVVTGVREPVPKVGESWNSPAALAGIRLVKILNERYERGQLDCWPALACVDVSNWDGSASPRDGRLRIGIVGQSNLIHWGLPPGQEHPVEAPVETKLAHLDALYRGHAGRFPDGGPIDIRAPDRVLIGEPR